MANERHHGVDVGDIDAPHTILWIHGYTGSPDAFTHTAERLADSLDARVLIPLLPGHGSREENLPRHTLDDFVSSARYFFHDCTRLERPLAIIGYSFGGYIALLLAAEKNPAALVLALTPFELRFPFWLPGVAATLNLLPFWGKHLTSEDINLRRGTFYYPHLPGRSLALIHEGNERIREILPRIACPVLTLHNADDPLASIESGARFLKNVPHADTHVSKVFPHGRHTFFLGPYRANDEELVIGFLRAHFKNIKETAAL